MMRISLLKLGKIDINSSIEYSFERIENASIQPTFIQMV
jgi:hypothetical protein